MPENPHASEASSPLIRNIAERIEAEIMSLKRKPGEVYNLSALSKQLGVSRTSVRAALTLLESRQKILKTPEAKYCVPPLDFTELTDMLAARDMCEHKASLLQCEVATQDAIERLYDLAFEIQKAILNSDFGLAVSYERAFHKTIIDTCGNPFLITMYNSIYSVVEKYMSYAEFALAKTSGGMLPTIVSNSHIMIVDAINSRMPPNVDTAIRMHFDTVLRILSSPGKHPYFSD